MIAAYGLLLLAVTFRAWQKFDGETAAKAFAVGLGLAFVLGMARLDLRGILRGEHEDD